MSELDKYRANFALKSLAILFSDERRRQGFNDPNKPLRDLVERLQDRSETRNDEPSPES